MKWHCEQRENWTLVICASGNTTASIAIMSGVKPTADSWAYLIGELEERVK